jgi:hypothetical protein
MQYMTCILLHRSIDMVSPSQGSFPPCDWRRPRAPPFCLPQGRVLKNKGSLMNRLIERIEAVADHSALVLLLAALPAAAAAIISAGF